MQLTTSGVLRTERDPARLAAIDWWRARWRGHTLDQQLAAGVPAMTLPALRARASLLCSWRMRLRVAEGVERAVAEAASAPSPLTSVVPVARAEVRGATPALRALAAELTSDRPVAAQGVAMARLLLVDADGPIYAHSAGTELLSAVAAARDGLATR